MKNFYVSLAVFLALVGLILWNACFIHRTADEMEARLTALSAPEERAVEELTAYWSGRRAWVDVSVPYEDIRALEEHLCEMQSAARAGEAADFETGRRLALNALDRIRQLERLSPENVF